MTIVPFLDGRAFRPEDIQAMSTALEDICKTLNLAGRSPLAHSLSINRWTARSGFVLFCVATEGSPWREPEK